MLSAKGKGRAVAATTSKKRASGRRKREKIAPSAGPNEREPWRSRRLVNGRWVHMDEPAPTMAADQVADGGTGQGERTPAAPSDFVVMSVKMRRAEADAFRALCAELDVSANRAFRAMARNVSGYLEIDGTIEHELRAAVRQLRGIATNVNQIAKAGNRTRMPGYAEFMRERRALGPVLLRLVIQTRRILDVSARRSDGRERLRGALERQAIADQRMVNGTVDGKAEA